MRAETADPKHGTDGAKPTEDPDQHTTPGFGEPAYSQPRMEAIRDISEPRGTTQSQPRNTPHPETGQKSKGQRQKTKPKALHTARAPIYTSYTPNEHTCRPRRKDSARHKKEENSAQFSPGWSTQE